MRIFKVPFDIKREEKIFGGYLSLRQVLYIMLGASSLGTLAMPIPLIIKIFFISSIATFFLLCSFLKIGEQNLFKYTICSSITLLEHRNINRPTNLNTHMFQYNQTRNSNSTVKTRI